MSGSRVLLCCSVGRTSSRLFGSGNETPEQLEGRFGGENETANQREGRSQGGRASLKQPSPVYYSGRAQHLGSAGCGEWVDIKELAAPTACRASAQRTKELAAAREGGIRKRCPQCKKSAYFSTQNLKVVKGKVVKRKR